MDKDQLERYLDRRLAEYEEEWGIDTPAADANDRLSALIMTAFNKTERQVVVLVDEYDAPLLDVVHEDEKLPLLRNVMRNFYSPLKDCEPYLRFVFLTGITKFDCENIMMVIILQPSRPTCTIRSAFSTRWRQVVLTIIGSPRAHRPI